MLVLWVLSWLLAPLVTRLLALGVSRKREYLADAMSAQFTRNPGALASALQKIEHAAAPTASIKRGSAHLCIADPLGRRLTNREGFFAELLGTHPPMAIRVSKLKAMAYQQDVGGADGRWGTNCNAIRADAARRDVRSIPIRSLCSCPISDIRHLTSIIGLALGLLATPGTVSGQYLTRPQIPWRTINTARFDIHFPAEMEEWTRVVAHRMETVADAVNAIVGNAPSRA